MGFLCCFSLLLSSKYTPQFLFCFVELGKGWAPAVADSVAEFDNIGRCELLLNDSRSFWIGGSSNITTTSYSKEIDYSDYIAGNLVIKHLPIYLPILYFCTHFKILLYSKIYSWGIW